MSAQIIDQIKAVVAELEKDGLAFFEKGNKAAGTRTRKSAQQLKTLAQDLRNAVTEAKNAEA